MQILRNSTENPKNPFNRNSHPAKIDGFVKSLKLPIFVIPAKAGIQLFQGVLDPGFRRGDGLFDFLRDHQNSVDSESLIAELLQVQPSPALGQTFWRMKAAP
jgi:hypothetical protein